MAFFKRKGSTAWHSTMKCSKVPRNVKTNKAWIVTSSKRKAKPCVECVAKGKPKARPKRLKKRVTEKKRRFVERRHEKQSRERCGRLEDSLGRGANNDRPRLS